MLALNHITKKRMSRKVLYVSVHVYKNKGQINVVRELNLGMNSKDLSCFVEDEPPKTMMASEGGEDNLPPQVSAS